MRAILINVFVPSPNANLSRLASLTISNLLAPSASTSFASTPTGLAICTLAGLVPPDSTVKEAALSVEMTLRAEVPELLPTVKSLSAWTRPFARAIVRRSDELSLTSSISLAASCTILKELTPREREIAASDVELALM